MWRGRSIRSAERGLAQGRLFQMAAYMLCIALFAVGIAPTRNWRNDSHLRKRWLGNPHWRIMVLSAYRRISSSML